MKVCILGSGLSSLTLAKTLVNKNIFVDVYFSKKKQKQNQSRTISITKSNIDFFQKYILNIEKILWKIDKIEIFTENLKNDQLINFENNHLQLFSIFKNYKLFELLEKSLNKNKFFKKFYLKDKIALSGNYDLIINTDLANSFTKKFFSKKIEKKYNSFAYTSVINHKKIPNHTASQIFTKNGPLAFLPISSSQTSVVYSINKSKIIKNDNLIELIKNYNLKYNIRKIEKFNYFKLVSVNLRKYYHKNILAFGDMLHKIHPLAGQGFNMTIRDIKVLLDIINFRINLGLPLDSSVNKEFEQKTKSKNFVFSNGIEFIHDFFYFENKIKNNILSQSIKFLGKNYSINKLFTRIADKGEIF
tara:strand:+ start:149 stop:1225 length:1077 start_codon:yes stop_codon:yes gene_type:complete